MDHLDEFTGQLARTFSLDINTVEVQGKCHADSCGSRPGGRIRAVFGWIYAPAGGQSASIMSQAPLREYPWLECRVFAE